jgi:hypothetical protein
MEGDVDHAEVRERLLDLALEPARLREVDEDAAPGAAELRAHLAACAACTADLAAWRATFAAVDAAVSADPSQGEDRVRSFGELALSAGSLTPPAALRERTLSFVLEEAPAPLRLATAPRRLPRTTAWLAIAAALVVFVGGAAIAVDRSRQLDQARADSAALAGVTATLDRILQDPGHRVATLMTPAGTPAGSLSWSASDGTVAVLTTALQAPPAGQVYRCWIEQGGARVPVGEMQFAGSTAYWAGSMTSWGYAPAPGDRFTVNLEPIAGGGGGAPALVTSL